MIEGHTSWGLWTYLNSSCCNTLSISYFANHVSKRGRWRDSTNIYCLGFFGETVLFHFTLKGKKPLKYCHGIRCSAGLLNLQSLKNLMTVCLVGIIRRLMNNMGIFATALIINTGMPPANHTFCLIANYQLFLN